MTLPLFDAPPTVAVGVPLPTTPTVDIRRVISHKTAPFIELQDGKPTGREFEIIERHDGLFLWRFTDNGALKVPPQAVTSALVDDAIRYGIFTEREP